MRKLSRQQAVGRMNFTPARGGGISVIRNGTVTAGNAPLVATTSGADIRSAVRKQLGLRVQPQRGAVEILKIDSIEKVPTRN
jgi:uncharacterized protein (TIGR03435 family)